MGRLATFLRVTLPLSRQGMLAAAVITALPMTGDYYTTDLLSGSPRTSMIGNQIEFYLFEGSQKACRRLAGPDPVGAAAGRDGLLPALGRPGDAGRCDEAGARRAGGRTRGGARSFLATITWLYIVWSIVPVLIAIQFSFNSGRSRSTWQGFSFRWWWGDPTQFAAPRRSLRPAMREQPRAGRVDDAHRHAARRRAGARAGPVAGPGRPRLEPADAGAAVDPRDRDGRRCCSSSSTTCTRRSRSVARRMLLGHVTFSVSYVVVIVRAGC